MQSIEGVYGIRTTPPWSYGEADASADGEADGPADPDVSGEPDASGDPESPADAEGLSEGSAEKDGTGIGVGSGTKREGIPISDRTTMSTKIPSTMRTHGRPRVSSRGGSAPG